MGIFGRSKKKGSNKSLFPGQRLPIDEILQLGSSTAMIIELSYGLSDKINRSGYESLSHAEKVLNSVYWLETEINNGGCEQYYFNSSGDNAVDAPAALEELGANRTAAIVAEANSAFPGGEPPRDRNERIATQGEVTPEIRAKWSELDKRFLAYADPLGELQVHYMRSKKDEINLFD